MIEGGAVMSEKIFLFLMVGAIAVMVALVIGASVMVSVVSGIIVGIISILIYKYLMGDFNKGSCQSR